MSKLLVFLCAAMLAFTFMPTGVPTDVVLQRYNSTLSFKQSPAQMTQYIDQMQSTLPEVNSDFESMKNLVDKLVAQDIPYECVTFNQPWNTPPEEIEDFCCASFVSYVLYNCGLIEESQCSSWVGAFLPIMDKIEPEELAPGDIILFWKTYEVANPSRPTHIGIYMGEDQMAHSGSPAQYTSLDTTYWRDKFYGCYRLRSNNT